MSWQTSERCVLLLDALSKKYCNWWHCRSESWAFCARTCLTAVFHHLFAVQESAVAKDMERFNQQQALGRPKPMSDVDELAFVKELAGAGGGGGKMTL